METKFYKQYFIFSLFKIDERDGQSVLSIRVLYGELATTIMTIIALVIALPSPLHLYTNTTSTTTSYYYYYYY